MCNISSFIWLPPKSSTSYPKHQNVSCQGLTVETFYKEPLPVSDHGNYICGWQLKDFSLFLTSCKCKDHLAIILSDLSCLLCVLCYLEYRIKNFRNNMKLQCRNFAVKLSSIKYSRCVCTKLLIFSSLHFYFKWILLYYISFR